MGKYFLFATAFILTLIAATFLNQSLKSPPESTNISPVVKKEIKTRKPADVQVPKISLEKVFNQNHEIPASIKNETITMLATGDIIPARMVNYKSTVQYKDPLWSVKKVSNFLKNADITLINLESPLVPGCKPTREGMIFCGDPSFVHALTTSGVDVANLANNHAGNYGQDGLNSTIKVLTDNKIATSGLSDTTVLNIKGVKFAFLGYNDIPGSLPIPTKFDEGKMIEDIRDAKEKFDVVIVSLHWGNEYVFAPEERQIKFGHLAIDAGADIVVGNHPHWYKPVEIYKGKLITYGHGNFIFDQEWSEKTKLGVIGKYTFYQNQLIDAEFFPIKIFDFGQPDFLQGKEKEKILEEMKKGSRE